METSLNKIMDRITNVFSVFDFSYIISGIAAFMIIYTYLSFTYSNVLLLLDSNHSWIFIIFIIYILGLIMFTLGRYIRQEVFGQNKSKYQLFKKYGFSSESVEEIDALLSQYWNNLRNDNSERTYDYYNRLWVMTAIYEGLAGSAFLASALIILCFCRIVNSYGYPYGIIIILSILLLMYILIYILFREAKKNAETIITDLIAINKK
jgi:hypothetical protein